MISRIQGVLLEKNPQEVLVEVGGLAYEVQVPMTTVFDLPEPGQQVTLYTHFVVREDAQLLYGFGDTQERALFRVLIRVSGVGPKVALNILSGIAADNFVACVHNNDVDALVKLPGIGKKTAERLIIEVRDRLKEWEGQAVAEVRPAATGGPDPDNDIREAETALIALGYKPQEASRAIVQAFRQLEDEDRPATSEALIRLALRNMA